MKNYYFLFSLGLSSLTTIAQPTIEWQKAYGSNGNDWAERISPTNDGGYIVAATVTANNGDVTGYHNGSDAWIFKMDKSGAVIWQKSLGGSEDDEAMGILQTNDGNYLALCKSSSSDGDVSKNKGKNDIWLVKLDQSGIILWEKSYGGSNQDNPYDIKETNDGGFVIVGSTSSSDGDIINHNGITLVIKTDNLGNISWQKTFSAGSSYCIAQTKDGGYIMGANPNFTDNIFQTYGANDWALLRLNSNGDLIWKKQFGGSKLDILRDVCESTDGGFILSGFTWSNDHDVKYNHGDNDAWVVKTNTNGETIWQQTYGGVKFDAIIRLKEQANGNLIFAATTESPELTTKGYLKASNYWIASLDNKGNMLWQTAIGGSKNDNLRDILQLPDGSYILCGYTYSEDGDANGCGIHDTIGCDVWIIKSGVTTAVKNTHLSSLIKIYPTVTTGIVHIDSQNEEINIRLYDMLGCEIKNQTTNEYTDVIDFASYPAGNYLLRVSKNDEAVTYKISYNP